MWSILRNIYKEQRGKPRRKKKDPKLIAKNKSLFYALVGASGLLFLTPFYMKFDFLTGDKMPYYGRGRNLPYNLFLTPMLEEEEIEQEHLYEPSPVTDPRYHKNKLYSLQVD